MSKRFKAEIEFKKNTKEEEFNRKLLHNIKVAERKQKEKNKNLNANDFPIIKEIPEHRDRNLWKRKSYNKVFIPFPFIAENSNSPLDTQKINSSFSNLYCT